MFSPLEAPPYSHPAEIGGKVELWNYNIFIT